MEPLPDGERRILPSTLTALGYEEERGVVIVDVDRTNEAERVGLWLRLKGHRTLVAPWRGLTVERLVHPVVGIVTDHPAELPTMAARYPRPAGRPARRGRRSARGRFRVPPTLPPH